MNIRQDAARNIYPLLTANNITSGTRAFDEYIPSKLKYQHLFGNKCGHNIDEPRIFIPPSHHKKRPPKIERAKQLMERLYKAPLSLPAGKLCFHPDKANKSGRLRKIRSELREAIICRVGIALLHFNNLEKMQLGFYIGGKFKSYDINILLKQLKNITVGQLRRALKTFEKHGYVTLQKTKEMLLDGSWRSLPTSIKLTSKLYLDLGLTPEEFFKHKKKETLQFNSSKISKTVEELPGKNRKREEVSLYHDYTGCSNKKPEILVNPERALKTFFDQILNSS